MDAGALNAPQGFVEGEKNSSPSAIFLTVLVLAGLVYLLVFFNKTKSPITIYPAESAPVLEAKAEAGQAVDPKLKPLLIIKDAEIISSEIRNAVLPNGQKMRITSAVFLTKESIEENIQAYEANLVQNGYNIRQKDVYENITYILAYPKESLDRAVIVNFSQTEDSRTRISVFLNESMQ